MQVEQAAAKPEEELGHKRGVGAVVLRVIGGAMLATGLVSLLGLLGIEVPWIGLTQNIFPERHTAFVMGIWVVHGVPAVAHRVAGCTVLFFAGIQLLRMRRNGWIAALVFLSYDTLSLLLSMGTRQVEVQLAAVVARAEAATPGLHVGAFEQTRGIDRAYRAVTFVLICFLIPLLYLASEWGRFLGRKRRPASAHTAWAKIVVGVAVLPLAWMWMSWGAERVLDRQLLRKAREAPRSVSQEDFARVSQKGKRELTALLVRRLVADRDPRLAETLRDSALSYDLSSLTAEDVEPIIATARSSNETVQVACWQILAQIGTREAEACLREAMGDGSQDVSDTLLGHYAGMRPSKVPDFLLKQASEEGDGKGHLLGLLANFRDRRVLSLLIEAARDANPEVRASAVMRIDSYPCAEAERALLACLEDPDSDVRLFAPSGLHAIGTEDSMPRLIELLKGPDQVYRPSHSDSDSSSHSDLNWVLMGITGQDFGEDGEAWERWWQRSRDTFDLPSSLVERMLLPLPPPE